ncbi:MAG: DUF1330 domain-containing protein [Defluviicoccus sp.]|nr:DUF1330 domain-containing protein [Defluviicoccus sp.]MDE0384115.1 DUF1330 domain-containing protein [Defluviicoccus sp.]
MAAYLIAETREVRDPELLKDYVGRAVADSEAAGGRVVAMGPGERLEGDWTPQRLVVVEFESMAALKAWYNAPSYQELIPMREKACDSRLVIVGE